MDIDNMEVYDADKKIYKDIKYGFVYPHEVNESHCDKQNLVSLVIPKYKRRVGRFLQDICEPTIFFRTVRKKNEIEWINEHWHYAEKVVKRYNSSNRIVYLYPEFLPSPISDVESYELKLDKFYWEMFELRDMFSGSDDLLEWCNHLISKEKRIRNIDFDIKSNAQKVSASFVNHRVNQDINEVDKLILKALNSNKEDGIWIWGAGRFGKSLAAYLERRGVLIKGLIDNDPNKRNDKVVDFESVDDGEKIFIAIMDEKANESIIRQIDTKSYNCTKVVMYKDLYGEIFKK